MMRDLTRRAKRNPVNKDIAALIVSGVSPKDYAGECQAVMDFLRSEIRYTLDTNEIEVLHTPLQTLRLGYGDCDDFSIAAACYCECLGHPARFVAMGFDLWEAYSHVIVQVRLAGDSGWISLDATEPHAFGWTPPRPTFCMSCEIALPD